MAYGSELFWGVCMLILIPITMGYIGGTFGGDVSTSEENVSDININGSNFNNSNYNTNSNILANTYNGYAMFPVWFNIVITLVPSIMVLRSVFSV